MADKPYAPIGDVSCRATGYTIQQLQRMGLPTAQLTQGLVYTLEELQVQSASIPWEDYLVFLRNSHIDLPTDQLVELCTSYKGSSYLRPLLSAAGLWFHPAKYFQWVADPESGAIQQLFRCVKTSFSEINPREVLIEEILEQEFTLPPNIFWETQAIAFGALTTFFGLGHSIVTWEPIERGAAFRIRLPRRRPIRFMLSWLASWFRRDTSDDVRSALSFGHERSVRLEREIEERKKIQKALLESEERFRGITDAVPGIVYRYYLDPDGRQGFEYVSGGSARLIGFSPEELIDRPGLIWERIDPADIPHLEQSILESARNRSPWQQEFRIRTNLGTNRWFRGRSIPDPVNGTGRVVWHGIMTDVTAEKEADDQLRARDALLQKLSEQVPGFIYQYQQWPDGRSRFPYASEGIRDIYEVTPEEVRESAAAVFTRLHSDDYNGVAESIRISSESLKPWQCEYRVALPKQGIRWLDGHAVPERLPDGSTMWHGYIRDMTDRKRAEDTVRESENRFRTLIEDLQVGVVLITPDDRIVLSNPAACRILGLTYDQLHGVAAKDPRWEIVREDGTLFSPEDIPFSVVARTRKPLHNVTVGSRNQDTGHRTWMQVNGTPRLNPDGSLLHVILTLVDITERKRAAEALGESEERLRLALAAGRMGTFDWDLTTDRVVWSDTYYDLLGYPANERFPVEFRHFTDRLHPDDRELVERAIREAGETRRPYSNERRILLPDGTVRWMLGSGEFRYDSDGRPVRVLGTAIDITERKRAEDEIRQARDVAERTLAELRIASSRAEQFYRLCEVAGQGIGIARLDGALTYMNPAFRQMLELPAGDDITRRAFWQLVPAESHQFLAETVLAQTRETGLWSGEFDLLTLTGKRVPIINTVVLLRDLDGTVIGYSNIATDITERKRAEQALRESESRYRTLIETSSDAIFTLDLTGRILSSNPAAVRMHGYTLDELLAMRMQDLDLPVDTANVPDRMRRLRAGESLTFEVVHRRKDGTTFPLEVIASAVELGGESFVIRFDRDITERKRAKEREAAQLLRLQKLAELSLTLSGEPAVVYQRVVQMIGELFAVRVVCLSEIVDEQLHFRAVNLDGQILADAGVCPLDITPCATVQEGKDIRVFDSVADRFPQASFLRQHHANAYCGFPSLNNMGKVVAVTCLLDDKPHEFTEEDKHILRIIGQRLSAEIERSETAAERRRADAALQEAERRQRLALDAGRMGTWDWEIGSDRLIWDDREEILFGFGPGEYDGRLNTFLNRVHPDDVAAVQQVLTDATLGKDFDGEFRIQLASGEVHWMHGSGVVVPASDHSPAQLVGINYDVTGRKAAEAALRESEERLRIFVENAPAGVAMFDRDVRYISYSRRWLSDYGLGDQNIIGRSHYEVFPEVTDRWKEIHRRCLTGVSERCEQDRFERADGSVEYLRWEIQPWVDASGAIGGLVFFTEMITDRVNAEEQVRASLREKEIMLKEIHHRVKNNLQVISSLLSLQAARVTHPAASDVLAESQNRVRAMALVHETLYRSDDLSRVDLSRYLEELCRYLFRSFGVDSSKISLEMDLEPLPLSLDKTIPCGLLVTEVVSNSLKYAFPAARSGNITVRARAQSDGQLLLTLTDDGVGLPPDLVVDHTPSLGLQLVHILADQLGGLITVQRSPGTRFDISFPP
jgi:PAS domain S-box-containing protein